MKYLTPSLIIPVHHSTFSHYVEPISVLQELAAKTHAKSQVKIIKESTIVHLLN